MSPETLRLLHMLVSREYSQRLQRKFRVEERTAGFLPHEMDEETLTDADGVKTSPRKRLAEANEGFVAVAKARREIEDALEHTC